MSRHHLTFVIITSLLTLSLAATIDDLHPSLNFSATATDSIPCIPPSNSQSCADRWWVQHGESFTDGSIHITAGPSSSVSFTFQGFAIHLIGSVFPSGAGAKAHVVLDEGTPTTIDFSTTTGAGTRVDGVWLFTQKGLNSSMDHSITVTYDSSDYDPSGPRRYIAVDAFQVDESVFGALVPPAEPPATQYTPLPTQSLTQTSTGPLLKGAPDSLSSTGPLQKGTPASSAETLLKGALTVSPSSTESQLKGTPTSFSTSIEPSPKDSSTSSPSPSPTSAPSTPRGALNGAQIAAIAATSTVLVLVLAFTFVYFFRVHKARSPRRVLPASQAREDVLGSAEKRGIPRGYVTSIVTLPPSTASEYPDTPPPASPILSSESTPLSQHQAAVARPSADSFYTGPPAREHLGAHDDQYSLRSLVSSLVVPSALQLAPEVQLSDRTIDLEASPVLPSPLASTLSPYSPATESPSPASAAPFLGSSRRVPPPLPLVYSNFAPRSPLDDATPNTALLHPHAVTTPLGSSRRPEWVSVVIPPTPQQESVHYDDPPAYTPRSDRKDSRMPRTLADLQEKISFSASRR